ncbi:hypothetical protein ACFVQ0_15130 [Streptomyces sp. NPDC057900]|uniref:hypothetical protein n=1 Tax=Streptomyces sp. NPDC057900 TaxID=3346274 RepID=UPI0036E3DB2F
MPLPIPVRTTPRGARAVVVLAAAFAAVFASGWYLGQPVLPSRCEGPPRVVRYSDHLAADTLPDCEEKARLLAWFGGTFR